MKILLFGENGQVGHELRRSLEQFGYVIRANSTSFDLTETKKIDKYIRRCNPGLVVNAAAYTAVDNAERFKNIANSINHLAVAEMAKSAADMNIPLIHLSTDYVFDGSKDSPYTEEDTPNPMGVYGQTKLDGEKAITNTENLSYWIFRTSWVFSNRRKNFLNTMVAASKKYESLTVVNDQFGAPTWARTLADVIALCFAKDPTLKASGIYNLTSNGSCSWFGFAVEIMHSLGIACKIRPIPTSEYPTPAVRPQYSVLESTKLEDHFGLKLPFWFDALGMCCENRNQER